MGEPGRSFEREAVIFNIQKYNTFDGPGVRTLIFFKGCPLRCRWCANPEGLSRAYQVMFKEDLCTGCGACEAVCPVGIHHIETGSGRHVIDRNRTCIGCRACEEACIPRALSIAGEKRTISELMQVILEDKDFYRMSGGGVTLGGGEVSAQPEAARSLLAACHQENIHTAIETCGYMKPETLKALAEDVDLFLYDLKAVDSEQHYAWTGVQNEAIIENLQWLLSHNKNVHIRMPLIHGVNDGEDQIERLIRLLLPYRDYRNFKGVDLLPYHKLGVNKYRQLDMPYQITGDPSMPGDVLTRIQDQFTRHQLPVTIIRH